MRAKDTSSGLKILVLGNTGVGKSCLISVYNAMLKDSAVDMFSEIVRRAGSTIGVDFVSRKYTLSENRKVNLRIWDTAGIEKYRVINRNLYSGTKGVLLCFDLTVLLMTETIESWIDEAQQNIGEDCIKVLVGTKSDAAINEATVKLLTKYSVEKDLQFVQTSALRGANVDSAFDLLIRKIDESTGGKLGIRNDSSSDNQLPKKLEKDACISKCCC